MINVNELRIGNVLQDSTSKNLIHVSALDIYKLSKHRECDTLEPVPLTPTILLQCGFERAPDGALELQCCDFTFSCFAIAEVNQVLMYGGSPKFPGIWIKSLHHLQNTYFALEGEEMEIQEGILN